METSTIALLILFAIVYIALLFTRIGAAILAITGSFALMAGFLFIMTFGMMDDGWYLFFGCLWEVFWIGILVLVPPVAKIMQQSPSKKKSE